MMRIIKFRGKKICSSEWVSGYYYWNDCDNKPYIMIDCHEEYEVEFESVGQYTELHDSNGIEIYEGDIILYNHKSLYELVLVVFYDNDKACFSVREPDGVIAPLSNYMRYVMSVIVGNIYDNIELLNK